MEPLAIFHGFICRRNSRIPSTRFFTQYINMATKEAKRITVFINDGYVKPQLAYLISLPMYLLANNNFLNNHMREQLPENAYMIVFDTAKEENNYYSVIRQYYSVEKEYNAPILPGQEFTGITVFKNSKRSVSIQFPNWW